MFNSLEKIPDRQLKTWLRVKESSIRKACSLSHVSNEEAEQTTHRTETSKPGLSTSRWALILHSAGGGPGQPPTAVWRRQLGKIMENHCGSVDEGERKLRWGGKAKRFCREVTESGLTLTRELGITRCIWQRLKGRQKKWQKESLEWITGRASGMLWLLDMG